MDWLNWYITFASQNIYGFIPILGLIYALFFLLKKVFKKLPNPVYFVVLTFIVCIFTIPSIPRYTFENGVISKYKNAGEYKLVDSANWGAIVEPITLINTPIGFFHFVSPSSLSFLGDVKSNKEKGYRSQIYRYNEPVITQIIDANCANMKISISEPRENVFKYISFNESMNANEQKIYCKTDYSPQIKMFRCKYKTLSKMSKVSEELAIQANNQCKQK
jgi:energy-coupling factor transporter transmembrane protein EcfT